MFLPLTALLIGLSQQEGMSLSAGGPGWQFGPQLQFGHPAEPLVSTEASLLQEIQWQSDELSFCQKMQNQELLFLAEAP